MAAPLQASPLLQIRRLAARGLLNAALSLIPPPLAPMPRLPRRSRHAGARIGDDRSPTGMDKNERRDQILKAAMGVFAERGYHDTAIADIIDRAGIARGTFYLYFAGKRALFDDVLDRIFERILEQLQPVVIPEPFDDTRVLAQIRDNGARLVRFMFTERDACRVLLTEAGGLDEQGYAKLTSFYDKLGAWVASSLSDGIGSASCGAATRWSPPTPSSAWCAACCGRGSRAWCSRARSSWSRR